MARKYGFREFYSTFKTDFKANNDIERLQEMLGEKIAPSIVPSVASNLANNGLRRKEANQICLSGVAYYTDHFNCMFGESRIYYDKLPDKISAFQKKYSIANAVIQEFNDDIFQNLAVLLISAASNDLFHLKHSDDEENNRLYLHSLNIVTDIFDFMKAQNINDISSVSMMFHSGFDWYMDYKPNGRDALLQSMLDHQIQLRILINSPNAIQTVCDTKFLSTGYGSYPEPIVVMQEWKKLAKKRGIPLKTFPCIFFHSLGIIEFKNHQKLLYISHYIYNHISGNEHPKSILSDSDPYFEVYYNEFDFIWENGNWLYNPDIPE